MKKKPLIIIGAVIALLVVIVLALPLFVDVNRFKPTLQTEIGSALGRNVEIGNISLAIFSGGVAIDNLSISDDPAFSKSPFLSAKQLTVGVELLPLIFSKKLEVRSFTVVQPEVSLVRNASGTWNFSSLGGASAAANSKTKSSNPSGAANFSVAKLVISNGRIIMATVGSRAKPQVYEAVNLEASDLSYTTQFPFHLTAKTPGNGAVKLDGKAGPIDKADASLTPLDAKIDVQHLDVASTGFVTSASGIAGLVDFNGEVSSDGKQAHSKGTVKAQKLKLSPAGAPASVPVNVDYNTDYDLKRQAGELKQGDIHIGKALARLSGNYNTAGETPSVQMKLNGLAMPVPDLEGILPAVGVTLPSGARLESGTLEANLSISGPVDKLVITGPVNLSNGKLAGFNVGSKLGALGTFTGLGGGSKGSDTEIQTLSTNVRVDPTGTHAENLNLVVPSIGTITGNANISASGQLDCKMSAKLSGGGPASQLTGGLSHLGGGSSQGGGIPFLVKGTTSVPIFLPDVAGMAEGLAKNPAGALGAAGAAADAPAGIIGGLLGKKKKPQ
jgi:AsmA protein